MLEDHCNSADDVLGKWTDIKKEEDIKIKFDKQLTCGIVTV